MVSILLSCGSDVTLRNAAGQTVIDVAPEKIKQLILGTVMMWWLLQFSYTIVIPSIHIPLYTKQVNAVNVLFIYTSFA